MDTRSDKQKYKEQMISLFEENESERVHEDLLREEHWEEELKADQRRTRQKDKWNVKENDFKLNRTLL